MTECQRMSYIKSESCFRTVSSLKVYFLRIGTNFLAELYVEVPIADKISRNGSRYLVIGLDL